MCGIDLMRSSMTFNFRSVVKIRKGKPRRLFTCLIFIKTCVMSLRLNGSSSHLAVSCPPLFIVKSRFHFILKLLDLVTLVTFDVFQDFLTMNFVFVPTHYIKMRFFSLKPLEHSFVLSDNHLMVS